MKVVLCETARNMKDRERLKKSSRLGETAEIWQPYATWVYTWNLGPEKEKDSVRTVGEIDSW